MEAAIKTIRRPRRNRYSPEVVQDYKESGLSKSAYARQNGIHPNVLYRWIARSEEENQKDAFVRMNPVGRGSTVEIVLPDGITIRIIGPGISAVQVSDVVNAIRCL